MKRTLLYFLTAMMALLSACNDSDVMESGDDYGYLQFVLNKQDATRSVVEGNTLGSLDEARKVKVSLRYNGQWIEQTLNLMAPTEESARYSLTSENLKLMPGDYQLMGYALIGEYKSGDMAEILQVCEPDAPTYIHVASREMTRQMLDVASRAFGRFSAHLLRQEPNVQGMAAPVYGEMYAFADIDSAQIVLERRVGGVSFREDRKVKAYRTDTDMPGFDTDSIALQVGDYVITHIELFNKRRQFMYAEDMEVPFSIQDYQLTSTPVEVKQRADDPAINEGIALKKIWDAMDGKNWSWHEMDGNGGVNWVFQMADGSPRPITAWTKQVGVVLIGGRVVSLNLGSFNPKGDVPDAIGELTALEKLYLGMHTDEVYYELEGMGGTTYSLNPYRLGLMEPGKRPTRMEVARERTIIRQMNSNDFSLRTSRVIYKGKTEAERGIAMMRYAERSTYQQNTSDPANRITGISPAIGKLRNLQELYIANTLIKHLPIELGQLENLTDLELFNNPFEEVDGEIFRNMTHLTGVNFDSFYRMSQDQIQEMLDKMCTYCPHIQLLYMNRMKLERLPERLNYLTDLRLLDASFNNISSLKSIKPLAIIQFMMNYNRVTEIPADFMNIDDLELFSMTDNQLKEFPAVLSNMGGLYTIGEIDLQGNRMHGFQEGFHGVRVEKLKMGYNYLGRGPKDTYKGEMPRELSDTHSEINYLVLAGNNIDTIRNAAVADIKYVQALDLGANNLRGLPSYFNSEHFPYLTGIDLSHNRMEGFPNNILSISSLGQLLCADQGYYRDEYNDNATQWVRTMTEWPEYLHRHTSLTNVDLAGNDFRNVVNFPTQLTTLKVTNNPHIRMRIPQEVMYRIQQGLFQLICDEDQDIEAE